MKELLVVSGKGGSGKTSLCACFARLAGGRRILVDCDVDASDLPLLLRVSGTRRRPFYAGVLPRIDPGRCTGCGECAGRCRFRAAAVENGRARILPGACEGCGVCADHCPAGAILLEPRLCGTQMRSETPCGPLHHAALDPGAENSGKLVAELRKTAREEAAAAGADWIICDGPPGIGCPVISSATGADFAAVVTEPTVSGLHDLRRLAALLASFELPFAVIVNKADLNPGLSGEIAAWCGRNGIPVAGELPFDPVFPEAVRAGKTVLDMGPTPAAERIRAVWARLAQQIG